MRFLIDKAWDGRLVPDEDRAILVARIDARGLHLRIDAPYAGDPPPDHPPGPTPELWNHEVVEFFLLGADERYTEIEIGPSGHHLVLQLEGCRNPVASELPMTISSLRILGGRWRAEALVPAKFLPKPPYRANAVAIRGQGTDRRYFSAVPLPGDAPDFHRLEHFPEVELQGQHTMESGTDSREWLAPLGGLLAFFAVIGLLGWLGLLVIRHQLDQARAQADTEQESGPPPSVASFMAPPVSSTSVVRTEEWVAPSRATASASAADYTSRGVDIGCAPEFAIDGRAESAWCVEGETVGAELRLRVPTDRYQALRVDVANPVGSRRIFALEIEMLDGSGEIVETRVARLQRKDGWQTLGLREAAEATDVVLRIVQTVEHSKPLGEGSEAALSEVQLLPLDD